MKRLTKNLLFVIVSICLFSLQSCQDLDEINERLDALETEVSDLKSVAKALQDAQDKSKVITSVMPFNSEDGTSGWIIKFSDNTDIKVTNGTDGTDGKDGTNGTNGKDGTNGTNGTDGKDGTSLITVTQDQKAHTVTLTLQDGTSYTFSSNFIMPTSIVLLDDGPIYLPAGKEATIEFRVNPSNAQFIMEGTSCQLQLDKLRSTTRSYVHTPANYTLERVEVVSSAGGQGQYQAVIKDASVEDAYAETIALVLNTEGQTGEEVQISSSTIDIIGGQDVVRNGLPMVIIDTQDVPIVSKEEYVSGTITVTHDDNTIDYEGDMNIRGRGNSTWDAKKKPYKVKFDSKVSLFGAPKDKEWVLLANYYDKSMIRNDVAFWMAEKYGSFDYIPRSQFTDVMLNGSYNGTYQLSEMLKISTDRVNVGSDGFLLEIDGKAASDDITFKTSKIGSPINIKDPDVVLNDDNYTYIKNYVRTAENVLFSDYWLSETDGYKNYIDMNSFVEWFLVNEITKNNDAQFYTSCFMHKSRTGKLMMGPLWDFDLSLDGYVFNNSSQANANNPEGFHIKKAVWINRMFSDPEFVAAVKERFNVYYAHISDIQAYMDARSEYIRASLCENNNKWGVLCNTSYSDNKIITYQKAEVKKMKEWLQTRMDWLKTQFDNM